MLGSPRRLMDALSEMLHAITLDSAVYFNAEFSEPWCILSPEGCTLAPTLSAEAAHVIIYHLLCEGGAYVIVGGERVDLEAGDLIAFPHGDEHVLGAGGRVAPIDANAVLPRVLERELELLQMGGGGALARFICGFLVCDRQLSQAFLGGLPRLIRVNIRTDRSGQWLENSLRFAVTEAANRKTGANAMLTKLSEVVFAETLRRFVHALPEGQKGWLAGARDPEIGKALTELHHRPAHPWTVADLAREAGVSRTVLAERFRHFLDDAPMAYLTKWRLRLAARALLATNQGVAQIASEVGYESESAFNRAFKRAYGLPPARYRREKTVSRADGE